MSETMTVEELIARSKVAQKKFEFATQEQADAAARAVCKAVYDNAEMLGALAVEDSRMGNLKDKIAKCRNKSALIWNDLKDKKSVGIINRMEDRRMLEIAKPMGVVASLIPSTNPVVTPMSNAAFALKTRNSVIFSPHPRATKCVKLLTEMFRTELAKLGFPEDLVLCIENATIENSASLMSGADVTVATGGMAMVKAAYSSGKPALGVGQGNVQCIVDDDVDLAEAAEKIITGRSFDNGLICLGEQCVFVPKNKYTVFVEEMKKQGAFYIDAPEAVDQLRKGLFPDGAFSRVVVGRNAAGVAEGAGIKDVPADARVLVVPAAATGSGDVLCREKLCPVVAIMAYDTFEQGVAMMVENLEHEGKGHSICVHSNNPEHVQYAALQCSVCRVVVNQPSGTTGGGSPNNGFVPTTTLGCGSWGNNSFSGNLSYFHLMNITRVGYPCEESVMPDMDQVGQ